MQRDALQINHTICFTTIQKYFKILLYIQDKIDTVSELITCCCCCVCVVVVVFEGFFLIVFWFFF